MVIRLRACVMARLLGTVVIASYAPAVLAQDTRAAEITKKQEEKAANTSPYRPTTFERIMNSLEASFTNPPNGFFPTTGSVYSGGGFALGAGYRRFYGRQAVWDVKGLYSIRNYKWVEVGTRTPWDASGRLVLSARAGWMDATQIGYYGLGPATSNEDRANFRLKQTYAGGAASLHPTRWAHLDARVTLEDISNEEGLGRSPSIETRYPRISAPGLFSHPLYIHTETSAAIDWRTSPGYSRSGGYYGVKLVSYADQDDATFSFRRVDGELVQHLPVLRENWVVSLRGRIQSTLGDEDVVPYYLLPALGSGGTLRGYSTGRFRDRQSLLTSVEFRWIPNRTAMDMAFFYDAGKVASRREDLDFNDLKTNWGIGARFHTRAATALRIELARGSEGFNLVFATSAAF
jgi:hypothetical protein